VVAVLRSIARWNRVVLALGLGWAALAPGLASAQDSAIVLGVRSFEGDDEFAHNLTGALRHEASQVPDWALSDREVTFAQMALVHGCDDPQPSCLGSIAESLSVQRVIFGDVRRTSAGSDYDFSVNLHHFNAESGRIEHSVADQLASVQTDIDNLREPARRWIASLSGAPPVGALSVQVNVPGAEVLVDGEAVGVVDAEGTLRLSEIEAGRRAVRVTAPGYAAFTATVTIEAYGEATLEGELTEGGGGGGGGGGVPVEVFAGVGLLIVAAGAAGGWIYSGITVLDRNNSQDWAEVRAEYSDTISNLCDSPGTAREREICDEVATLEILQFVFAGVTAVAGGVGLGLLIVGLTAGDDAEESAFQLVPSIGLDHAYLGARVRF